MTTTTPVRPIETRDAPVAFKVSGMDCPTCAGKVEAAVARFPGVTDVRVNFANQVLSFRASGVQTGAVEEAVRKLGYGVEPISHPARRELRFRVSGMDCPSCGDKVSTAVGRLSGSSDVKVNFSTQVLTLNIDPVRLDAAAVESSVKLLGYGIEPVQPSTSTASEPTITAEAAEPPLWATPKARLLFLLLATAAIGFLAAWQGVLPAGWAYTPTAILGLAYFGRRALVAAVAGTPFSIEMLVSLATAGAVLIGASSEAAVVIILFLVGELLEGFAARRARAGIRSLLGFMPRTAAVVDGDAIRNIPIEQVEVGQLVLVRPGDRIPVDGEIVEGTSAIDEAAVTGESMPVSKGEGAQVFAGSVSTSGVLKIRVTRRTQDNTINRIIHLVEEAQATKAPTARFIDRFSRIYTPLAVLGAGLVMIGPPLLVGADWSTWVYRGLAVLLVACPCALVLSTPAAIASALAAGTRRGLLIKGGAALETMGRVRTVAFDKTGTLTAGRPVVTDVLEISGNAASVLALAASVETGSSHPIARAIIERANETGLALQRADNAHAIAGKAMAATIAGRTVLVGSPRYASELGIVPDSHPTITHLEEQGKTVVVVADGDRPIGFIAVRDEPRPDSRDAIRQLKDMGVHAVMLTGDNQRTGAAVAKALGLDVRAELLPDQKLIEIARLKETGLVAMVGDGINDAPALAAANVGIAMGGGTDVALETADAGLLHERVGGVVEMIDLSRRTLNNIRQNIIIALGLKAVFLVTTVLGVTGLWPAIMADTGATVLVTLNALRLLGRSPATGERAQAGS